MEENNNNIGVDTVDTGEVDKTATDLPTQDDTDTISMSKSEFDKALQSAEDKVRNKLHKQIKELESKLSVFEQSEKSDSDKEIERRVAEIEMREKVVALKEELHTNNLDRSFADYLKDNVDMGSFSALIEKVLADKVKAQGYVPSAHQSNPGVTLDDWKKMDYTDRAKFMEQNPDMARRYAKEY